MTLEEHWNHFDHMLKEYLIQLELVISPLLTIYFIIINLRRYYTRNYTELYSNLFLFFEE